MKIQIFILAAAMLASSAKASPRVQVERNPVTGETSAIVTDNFVPCNGGPRGQGPAGSVSEIQFTPVKLSSGNYALMIVYGGTDWMFVGGDIVLNIDGKLVRHRLVPSFSSQNVEGSTIRETAAAQVKRSDLAMIANGKKVLAQVSGRNGTLFATFKPKNIQAFQQFLAQVK